jgi:hypothetical protein
LKNKDTRIGIFNFNSKDTLSIDHMTDQKIDILFNITFPRVSCIGTFFLTKDLHVDVIDASGAQQIDIHHKIHKHPVDSSGNIIGMQYEKIRFFIFNP